MKAFRDFRGKLDAAYLESRKDGEVVEKRLEAYFVSSEPRDSWHSTMDALTVRYFHLTDQDTDRLYDANEGPQHTGLSKMEMRDPQVLLNRYRDALAAAVQSVFKTSLQARSGDPEGKPSRVGGKAQTDVDRKSGEAPTMLPDPTRKWKDARRWSLIGLGCIAAATLIGLIFAWRGYKTSNTLRFELAKTFMQVLAVAVLGGLAAIATFYYQYSRAQEDEDMGYPARRK